MPDPSPDPKTVIVLLGPGPERERPILGLSPADRIHLSAAKEGVTVIEAGDDLPIAAGYAVAVSDVLGERSWMSALHQSRPSTWSRLADVLVHVPGSARGVLVEALADCRDVPALATLLEKRLGAPGAWAVSPEPLRLTEDAAVRKAAKDRLMAALVKDTDGFLAKHIARPISLSVSRRLAPTSITPNQMTIVTGAIGVLAAPFFLSSAPWLQAIGGALFLLHSILDGCDGELARLKFKESRWGGLLDFWSDNVVHVAVFGCMAAGWAMAVDASWPLWFGAGAVLGTIGSASLVHWRVLRPKKATGPVYTSVSATEGNRLSELMDGLSRRDFIYLVFALSLFGKAAWFLALAGVGTPIFLALLLFLAARERVSAG